MKISDAILISRKYGMTTHLPDSLIECISSQRGIMDCHLEYLSKTFAPTRTISKSTPGHETCKHCSGMGFTRSGEFGIDRKFPPCVHCKGLGQKYLEAASRCVFNSERSGRHDSSLRILTNGNESLDIGLLRYPDRDNDPDFMEVQIRTLPVDEVKSMILALQAWVSGR